ncbi:MAG TPA: thioredoxin domain-containing protein [Acidobacteriota bacterium]|nr:thioredoxin domain-containing protein [Acidobacteriota bacterium]
MLEPRPNRLIHESSPYLKQHAHNPVNWYPWSDEALAVARQENKPILLSVGYSSCHWCHVMERESFENTEIAGYMNQQFVNIKVDREERPDLDNIYMNYVQMTTGSGGWPLTVFLTPSLVPFFGGTYFPPIDVSGRPGFSTVLRSVSTFYGQRKQEIESDRTKITGALSQTGQLNLDVAEPTRGVLEQAADSLLRQIDPRHGGFGDAPKFPASMALSFLMRWHKRTSSKAALDAVRLSLDKMAQGGIYDHLGGGFHRYAVDERWFAPHFEKMLYDNALLASTYLDAFQVTGDENYRRVVEETLQYVERDMRHPSGGFYSAEDADSEGHEGLFYVWDYSEVRKTLPSESCAVFCEFYGVSTVGNWEGRNILHKRRELSYLAADHGKSEEELSSLLKSARDLLLEKRKQRVRPELDDKILASWNGLMLTAFSKAAFVLGDQHTLDIATENATFLAEEMISEGRVLRAWKDGVPKLNGYLEDYAQTVEGFLTLFQVGGDFRWLGLAQELTETQIRLFWDPQSADFFFTSTDHEQLLIRPKEQFDNATPSGNSTSVLNLLTLAHITGESTYQTKAEQMLHRMGSAFGRFPSGLGNWLAAADFNLGPVVEVAILGDRLGRQRLLQPLREAYLPNKVVVATDDQGGEDDRLPILEGRQAIEGEATAYVCEAYTCREPTSDPERLRVMLREFAKSPS